MRKIKRDIVAAIIFSKDHKLFQGMKDSNGGGVYADCWHIPGGGRESGEDLVSALIREIKEETSIDISPYKIELVDDADKGISERTLATGEKVIAEMTFYVYKVVITDKNSDEIKIQLNDDLIKYHWVDLQELKNFKLTPPSVKLFKKLGYL